MKEDIKVLILAGGASSRMGMDKGDINYHGKAQKYYLSDMMSKMGLSAYISQKPSQTHDQSYQFIFDKMDNVGPMAGILAAFENHHTAWLVIACDYPFLKPKDISNLIENREAGFDGCFYRNDILDIGIPTLGIYEKSIYENLQEAFLSKAFGLRKVLNKANVKWIPCKSKGIESVDTYERSLEIKSILNGQ